MPLAGMTTRGNPSAMQDYLASLGSFMLGVLQTHQAYPVLRYFHFREVYYALPRLIFVALDAATLICAATDQADLVKRAGAVGSGELIEEVDCCISRAVLAQLWGEPARCSMKFPTTSDEQSCPRPMPPSSTSGGGATYTSPRHWPRRVSTPKTTATRQQQADTPSCGVDGTRGGGPWRGRWCTAGGD